MPKHPLVEAHAPRSRAESALLRAVAEWRVEEVERLAAILVKVERPATLFVTGELPT